MRVVRVGLCIRNAKSAQYHKDRANVEFRLPQNSATVCFIFADKTRKIYEASLDTYNKLLHDNITKTYKHGSEDTIDEIDSELKDISNNLGIGDKIEKMKKREAFISLKDHKENFENNPKCRLINPAKANQEN